MFRYLPGIVLVQLVTLTLFVVNQGSSIEDMLLRAGLPALIISCVTALWLSTLGRMDGERRSNELREKHAEEREKMNREVERARAEVEKKASSDKEKLQKQAQVERERLVKQTHKQLMQSERSISRRANAKVGLSFMALTGLGVVMLITEMLTLGLLTITTAGGAFGGYMLRWRQSRQALDRLSGESSSGKGQNARIVGGKSVANDSGKKSDKKNHSLIVMDEQGNVANSSRGSSTASKRGKSG